MSLTETAIRNAKPREKPYKLYDTRGLFLLVAPAGGKWWRLKYRYGNKEKTLSLGVYPDISLKDARERRDAERKHLAFDVDPSVNRKVAKLTKNQNAANSFEAIAREWIEKRIPIWQPSHWKKVIARLENDIFPWLGDRPITEIKPFELLEVLRRIEKRGAADTAHRALQNCGQVFRYAVASGRAERDPTSDLRGALTPIRGGHFAAVTDPRAFASLLKTMNGYHGHLVTRCALRLAPMLFLRPGELRKAEWAEFDLEEGEWIIPALRMKVKDQGDHIVPLPTQAVAILRELHPLTGRGRFVFPCAWSSLQPMSENAVLGAMRRMGITKEETTGHGFRATARTILDEVLQVRPDIIEHQLAHTVKDPNGRAYNRTAHLPARREMMQKWANYLDELVAEEAIAA